MEGWLRRAFGMTDAVWRRHANPWSVWTRFLGLPALAAAIWSREWWDWWALAPSAVVVVWLWLNPRVFSAPRSTDNWTSKSILGERVWLERRTLDLPRLFHVKPHLGNAVAALGLALCAWGLWALAVWPTLAGLLAIGAGKAWFLAEMVHLYDHAAPINGKYRQWLY